MTARDEFKFPEGFIDDKLPKGTLSPSQYKTYLTCAKRYDYRYNLGRKRAPGYVLVFGSALHKGAEFTHQRTIDTGTPAPMEEASQAVSDEFDNRAEEVEVWEDDKGNPIQQGAVKDSAINSFKVYHQTAVPIIKPVKVEFPFAIKVGVVPVFGIIDLVDSVVDTEMSLENDPDNPNMVEVVSDLKTARRRWTDQRIRFDPQLTFYSMAENTENVRWDFVLTQKSGTLYEPKRSVRTLHDKKMLIEDVEEKVELIKKGYFPRCDITSWTCTPKSCGFYEDCRGPK